LLDKKQVI